jgi:hypothetical protein
LVVSLFAVLMAGGVLVAEDKGDSAPLPTQEFFLNSDGRLAIVTLSLQSPASRVRAVRPGDPCKAYWYDEDGDGVGAGSPLTICGAPPPGYVTKGGDCDPRNRDVFQLIPRVVRDGDHDLYTPDASPTTQCVGDSIIAMDRNGNPYAQWWKEADGRYDWLGAEFSLGLDPDDTNPQVPGSVH